MKVFGILGARCFARAAGIALRRLRYAFLLILFLAALPASAQFYYDESCKHASGAFTLFGDAKYTGDTGDDPDGDGWLRLTKDAVKQLGYTLFDKPFPTLTGVTMEFDFKIWGSWPTKADGFSVFLYNASPDAQPLKIGSGGGALCYKNLEPAYLGIGIDEYGNFAGDKSQPHRIVIRGNEPNYPIIKSTGGYLGGSSGPFGQNMLLSHNAQTTVRPSDAVYYRRLRIEIKPISGGMAVDVFLRINPSDPFVKVIDNAEVLQPVPSVLKMGFGAATGTHYTNHEVRNIIVRSPFDIAIYKTQPACAPDRNHIEFTTSVINDTQSPTDIEIKDSIPADLTLLSPITPSSGHIQTIPANAYRSCTVSAPVAGQYADGTPCLIYTYTFSDLVPKSYVNITYEGSFSTYPQMGRFITSASVESTLSNEDLNLDDNYYMLSGCVTIPPALENDTLVVFKNDSITFDALANDMIPCGSSADVDTVANSGLYLGSLRKNSNGTFTYKPTTAGVDSFSYFVKCDANMATAKVYILVADPVSKKYIACPGAKVEGIGFAAIPSVSFKWYTAETGGSPSTTANTITMTKSNTGTDIRWAEPVYKNITFPRIPVRLEMSASCNGSPTVSCVLNGSLLFKEDFGGNSPSDPNSKPEGIPQVTGYTYTVSHIADVSDGKYTITKQHPKWNTWTYEVSDHTYPNDPSRGYYLLVNAAQDPGQFYECVINNLCEGMSLYFSAYALSQCDKSGTTKHEPSHHKYILEDMMGNRLAQYNTGDIPIGNSQWQNYGFSFTVPKGENSVRLRIFNNGPGGNGNDFGLDDIEVHLCAAPPTLNTPATVSSCIGELTAEYTGDGTFDEDNLIAQWYKSETGEAYDHSKWAPTGNPYLFKQSMTGSEYPYPIISQADSGYYRLVVSDLLHSGSLNCSAISDIVRVYPCTKFNDDKATVQEWHSVEIDVFANDSLPQSFFSVSFSLIDSIKVAPKAGSLIESAGKLTYVSNGTALENNIDSFMYSFTIYEPNLLAYNTHSAWAYIYVLDTELGAAACYGKDYTGKLSHQPGVTFNLYQGGTSPIANGDGVVEYTETNITADVCFEVEPLGTHLGNFPKGRFMIWMVNTPSSNVEMIWTGHVDGNWNNPSNWSIVKTDGNNTYEAPAHYAPTTCANVTIPSSAEQFPDLTTPAYCSLILMKDRAMLRNPDALRYDSAKVEIKLKPAERGRYIMWSAPLTGMYSGDYRYSVEGESAYGDFFINFFQQDRPQSGMTAGGKAVLNRFTSSFSAEDQPLEFGRPFNLKVVDAAKTRDSLLRFPSKDNYGYSTITRPAGGAKFITENATKLPVKQGRFNNNAGFELVQIANPYMAYLDFNKFYSYGNNSDSINSGYYIWSGSLDDGFVAQLLQPAEDGNRYVVNAPRLSSSPGLIPPLQSFIVAKKYAAKHLESLDISPDVTTLEDPANKLSYTLRAAANCRGSLNMQISQGEKKAYAALSHCPQASSWLDPEDMPVLVHEGNIAVYTFAMMGEALAINSDSHFDMMPLKLGILAPAAGDVTLTFSNMEKFGYDIILVDNLLNKRINISENPSYTFRATKAGETNDRFALEMYANSNRPFTGDDKAAPQTIMISSSPSGIIIRSLAGNIRSVEIHDILGRLVYRDANTNTTELEIPIPPRNVYIIKVKAGEETIIEKTVIN
jgi:hypothetical protein